MQLWMNSCNSSACVPNTGMLLWGKEGEASLAFFLKIEKSALILEEKTRIVFTFGLNFPFKILF